MRDSTDSENKLVHVSQSNGLKYAIIGFLALMASGIVVLAVFIPLNWNVGRCDATTTIATTTTFIPTISASFGRETETSGYYEKAAVSADSTVCSSLGTRVLRSGGNAVDSAIVTVLCSGIQNIQSCGVGGGSFMMINDEKNNVRKFINCREKAPSSADKDMYVNGTASSTMGGMAIAIPGEMACLATAHDALGKLPWEDLMDFIIELIETNIIITSTQEGSIASNAERITNNEIFYNADGQVKKQGDSFVNQKLADIFRNHISGDKWAFHRGPLAEDIVQDIQDEGGIVTLEDLNNYKPYEQEPLFVDFGTYRMYVPPPPASGAVFAFIFNIMSNFKDIGELDQNDAEDFFHKLIESYKFAYGKRTMLGDPFFQSEFGDPEELSELVQNLTDYAYAASFLSKITNVTHDFEYYEPVFDLVEDDGTSHMNVIDENGMAVAITSTINTGFGSKVLGKRTGIIFNNEMDDFSTPGLNNAYGVPPSPSNFIEPGKQPMSSMTPIIVVDRSTKSVKFMAGASGGTRITTSVALVAIRALLFDEHANTAVQSARVHHQLIPEEARNEPRFDLNVKAKLEGRHHIFSQVSSTAVVQAIKESNGHLEAVSDIRKNGKPDGY